MSLTLEKWGERVAGGYRTLYHIGRNPPVAHPKNVRHWAERGQPGEAWNRPGRPPILKGVFLTDKKGLMGVRSHHGVTGHVYIYKVPNRLIHEAGGVRRYDNAREVLFSEAQWDKVKRNLIGKIDAAKFEAWIRDEGGWSEARDHIRVQRVERNRAKDRSRVAAPRYKNKKQVDKGDGSGKTTVYEYSERQVGNRNREKAKRVHQLQQDIGRVRKKYEKDLKSGNPKERLTALAVALIDQTYERVGNEKSAEQNKHYGVTTLTVGHVSVGKGKATLRYTGKSGVEHEKEVTDSRLVGALRDLIKGRQSKDRLLCDDAEDCVVRARHVNDYLREFGVTAKDLRGLHANTEMQSALRRVRGKKALPSDPKERQKVLKQEFKQALDEVSALVGHKASTLKSQYLVPGMEDTFLKDGSVMQALDKRASLDSEVWGDLLYRSATKSDGEREDEEAEKLVRRSPTKKPPRQDLERRRVEDADSESDPDKKQEEKDTSHNWKNTASQRLAMRFLMGKGSYKPSTRSKGKFRATNPEGASKTVDSEAEAKAFAGLDDDSADGGGGEGGPQIASPSGVDFNDDQSILDYSEDISGGFEHLDTSEVQDMVLEVWADNEDIGSEEAQTSLKKMLVDKNKERKEKAEKEEAAREQETQYLKLTDAVSTSPSFGSSGFDETEISFDADQKAAFMKSFEDATASLTSKDVGGVGPVSSASVQKIVDVLTDYRSSKKDKILEDPAELGEMLAKVQYYDSVISNPSMLDRSNPISDTPDDRKKIDSPDLLKKSRKEAVSRSTDALEKAKSMTEDERTAMIDRIDSELENLPADSKRAVELGAVKRGVQIAEVLENGQASRGSGGSMLTVLKALDKTGRMDIILGAGLGGPNDAVGGGDLQAQVKEAFNSIPDSMWGDIIPDDHPASDLAMSLSDYDSGQWMGPADRKYVREMLSRQITQDLVVLDPLAVKGGGDTAGEAQSALDKARRQALGDVPGFLDLVEDAKTSSKPKKVLEKIDKALTDIASAAAKLLGFGSGSGSGSGSGGKSDSDPNKPPAGWDLPSSRRELQNAVEDSGISSPDKQDLTPAQKKQEFLKDAPPEMRERVMDMDPQEFMAMLSAIADEDEEGDSGGVKTAAALSSTYSLTPWGRVSVPQVNSVPL